MSETSTSILSDEYKHVEGTCDHSAEVNGSRVHDTEIILDRKPHNEVSLPCRCPPEILGRIFSIVGSFLALSRSQLKKYPTAQLTSQLIPYIARLSHVCNYWREICLHDPRLWTRISQSLVGRWPIVFMERSGSVPLDIHIMVDFQSRAMLDAIVLALPRIRHLNVRGSCNNLTDFLQRLTLAAPIMETVEIRIRHSDIGPTITETVPFQRRAAIPGNLFLGCAPRLRFVHLFQCGISTLPIPALSNISTLKTQMTGSVEDAIRLLSVVPNISYLNLGLSSGLVSVLPPLAPGMTISLPELTTVIVGAFPTMSTAATFLAALNAPRLSRLAISIWASERPINQHVERVLHALSFIFATVSKSVAPWGVVALHLASGQVSEVALRLHHQDPEFYRHLYRYPYHRPRSPFSVKWNGDMDEAEQDFLLSRTLDILHADNVSLLDINWMTGHTTVCHRSLYTFRRIATLQMSKNPKAIMNILTAATPSHESSLQNTSEENTEELMFPLLERLLLFHLEVGERGEELVRVLRRFVLSRKREAKLFEIGFEACDAHSAKVMVPLRDIAKVTWNGIWCPPGGDGENLGLENWEGLVGLGEPIIPPSNSY